MRQRAPWTKSLVMILIPTLITGVGCDKNIEEANGAKRIYEGVRQAGLASGTERIRLLEAASREESAPPAAKIHVRDALGDAELAAARAAINDASAKASDVSKILNSLSRIARHIEHGNALVEHLAHLDPAQVSKQIATDAAQARGGGSSAWVEHEDPRIALPTLENAKSRIGELQDEVGRKRGEVAALSDQRVQALDEAGRLQGESLGVQGKRSVELFNQASAKRKEAAELQARVDEMNASLLPLERDLALVQDREQRVSGALASFDEQTNVTSQGWEAVQAESKAISATSGELISGDEQSLSGSIALEAEALKTAVGEYEAARDVAIQHLERAHKHYGDAATLAQTTVRSIQQSGGKAGKSAEAAAKAMADALAAEPFQLDQATAKHLKAHLLANDALLLAQHDRVAVELTDAAKAAGATLPDGLADATITDRKNAAIDEAKKAFTDATDTIKNLSERGGATEAGKTTQKNAAVAGMLAFYDFASFLRAIGDDPTVAQAHVDQARGFRTFAADKGAFIPPGAPAELLPAAATPAGEGAPATQPAT